MDIKAIKRVYFIGVGGIGMSALARFFRENGTIVHASDRTETQLTRQLTAEGIVIHYADDPAQIDRDAGLVIYTPAIPPEHKELNWYRAHQYPVYKRSDVLQWISRGWYAVTVAGTHGKTTVSAMIAFLLRESGIGCHAFLGGIAVNYQTNYWSSNNPVAVIEADEYDRSFLKLQPDIALLTAMDPDHLDIYGTSEAMEDAFMQYAGNIKHNGTLLVKHGLKRSSELKAPHMLTYSLQNTAADVYATHITQQKGSYVFDLVNRGTVISGIQLHVGGMHNVENMVAAIATACMLDVTAEQIKEIVPGFKGVKRRFEYVVKTNKAVYIDDYAHHPQELAALISSARRLFPNRKCVIAFQPHLYSRTRDLAKGFAASLDMADEILLLDIYPAREKPIEGISIQNIASQMANPAHTVLSKEGLLNYVATARPALLLTAGAGDIDQLVLPVKTIMEQTQ